MVFDGDSAPYDESRTPAPATVYGQSKLLGEKEALTAAGTVVLRMPLLYGFPAADRPSHFASIVHSVRYGPPTLLYADEYRTPLWLEDAARAVELAGAGQFAGVLHLGGPERLSRFEMGQCIAEALGSDAEAIVAGSSAEAADEEPRMRDLSLSSELFLRKVGVAPGRSMREAVTLALGFVDDPEPTSRP